MHSILLEGLTLGPAEQGESSRTTLKLWFGIEKQRSKIFQ